MALSSPYKPSRFISPLRARQLHRAVKNFKLTLICGLLTILVLRGALGAGKFGTPAKDFEEIKHHFERVHTRKQASRVLAEIVEERQRPLEAIEAQAHSTGDGLQGKYAIREGNLEVQFTFDLTKPSDWDAERRAKLRTSPNHVGRKMKIMLVTGYHPSACECPTGEHYHLKFVKNKVDYCKLHGIEILYNSAVFEADLSGLPAKLFILRKFMLTHPEVEWFWWMASDALFTDMTFELPLEKYENYNLVLHGWDNMQNAGTGLTSGSFLIRNCQWSLDMLDTWVPLEVESRVSVEAGKPLAKSLTRQSNPEDQPVFAHLLINEKGNLREEAPFEKSIVVHGYWETPVKQFEEETDKKHFEVGNESQPFMTRLVGHKLCRKGVDVGYDAALYFKYMQRALDFADSQVLQLNSYHKKSSSLSALQRLRGGHDGIMASSSDALLSKPDQSHSLS